MATCIDALASIRQTPLPFFDVIDAIASITMAKQCGVCQSTPARRFGGLGRTITQLYATASANAEYTAMKTQGSA